MKYLVLSKDNWAEKILGISIFLFFWLFLYSCPVHAFWRVEKRNSADGSLVWEKRETPGTAFAVSKDSTGLYVAGSYNSYNESDVGNPQWRVEKRSLTDGSLIWAKNVDDSAGADIALDVAVDSSGVYVVGVVGVVPGSGPRDPISASKWRVEKRNLSDGSLIWSQTVGSGEPNNVSTADTVSVRTDGIYAAGSENGKARFEKRNPSTGNLIWQNSFTFSCSISGSGFSTPLRNGGAYTGSAVDASGLYLTWAIFVCINNNCFTCQPKINFNDGSFIWNWCLPAKAAFSSIGVDSSGYYTSGGSPSSSGIIGDGEWYVGKRNLSTRSVIWEQRVNHFPDSGAELAFNLSLSGGVFVAGSSPPYLWIVEKRNVSDGSLLWKKIPPEIAGGARDVFADGGGVYVVGYQTGPSYIDCGLRVKDDDKTIIPACEPAGNLTSRLRIHKNGTTYGVVLVDPSDSNASGVKIWTSAGVKALRKFP